LQYALDSGFLSDLLEAAVEGRAFSEIDRDGFREFLGLSALEFSTARGHHVGLSARDQEKLLSRALQPAAWANVIRPGKFYISVKTEEQQKWAEGRVVWTAQRRSMDLVNYTPVFVVVPEMVLGEILPADEIRAGIRTALLAGGGLHVVVRSEHVLWARGELEAIALELRRDKDLVGLVAPNSNAYRVGEVILPPPRT
jgi:hypothetical protein